MKRSGGRSFAWIAALAVASMVSSRADAQQARPTMPAMTRMDPAAEMADRAMTAPMDTNAMKHMRMTPTRPATSADSVRALAIVKELRAGIAKYRDTTAAVADGFRMFAPKVKNQRIYHFTNYLNGFEEAFRFDAARPTSLLYEKDATGTFKLIGAMYTMPRRASVAQLDDRVPLGIARWHQHVNWCLPPRDQASRWTETRSGLPVFGPESPIATRAACDEVGGQFRPVLFGWMIHANVFAGDDLGTIFADHHGSDQGGQ